MKEHDNKIDMKPMSLMSVILSVLSLFVISGLLFFNLSSQTRFVLIGLDTFICSLFLIQLTTDLLRSQNRILFLREHWIDYLASIPLIEPLRFGRIFQVLRVIRLIRSGKQIIHQLINNRKEATLASILLLLLFLLTLGSVAILFAEGGEPNANIHNASDAWWWALVTVSTVGYGDFYPTTNLGRLIASIMLICGVGIFGMISGLVTSVIASPKSTSTAKLLKQNNVLLKELIAEQRIVNERLEKLEKNHIQGSKIPD